MNNWSVAPGGRFPQASTEPLPRVALQGLGSLAFRARRKRVMRPLPQDVANFGRLPLTSQPPYAISLNMIVKIMMNSIACLQRN